MRQHYQVNEIFSSVQGEGRQAGRMATFIRLQGCPVGCEWCDTKYTWFKGGERLGLMDIYRQLKYPWVVITGGEPVLYDLDPLMEFIREMDTERDDILYRIFQLETSGLNALKGKLFPDWITISPKYRLQYHVPDELLKYAHELKFVVDEHFKVEIAVEMAERHAEIKESRPGAFWWKAEQVVVSLMPEGSPPRKEMVDYTLGILEAYPEWFYSDRLQYRIGVP